LNECLNSKLQ